jgi:hypothetical protein
MVKEQMKMLKLKEDCVLDLDSYFFNLTSFLLLIGELTDKDNSKIMVPLYLSSANSSCYPCHYFNKRMAEIHGKFLIVEQEWLIKSPFDETWK